MLRASAPGKAILMGEHAAVYGRPALVAAIDRRLQADFATTREPGLRLALPQLGLDSLELAWQQVLKARETGSSADPSQLVKVALAEAAAVAPPPKVGGLSLEIRSEIPIGSGFGSSAAVAVAVVGGYLAWRGVEAEPRELHRLSLAVERVQHGNPSGVDNAAVIHGGVLWARRREDGGMELESLAVEPACLEPIRVIHTGPPAESTGAVVAAVRELSRESPERFGELLDTMEAATRDLRRLLTGPEIPLEGALRPCFRAFQRCLEDFGVVPEPVQRAVRAVEDQGGAAKVSGAGSLAGPGAGSLLVLPAGRDDLAALEGFQPLALRLGARGFFVE